MYEKDDTDIQNDKFLLHEGITKPIRYCFRYDSSVISPPALGWDNCAIYR